jgi:hypothetical protein
MNSGWAKAGMVGILAGLLAAPALAADHGDSPVVNAVNRQDVNITDLHLFTSGPNLASAHNRLIIVVSMNAGIPRSAQAYKFPSDLTVRVSLDNHSEVSFSDPAATAKVGGTVVNPAAVAEDVGFIVTFDNDGNPSVATQGLAGEATGLAGVHAWVGLRDDPFIRGPRQGRNIAAIVLSVPLHRIVRSGNPTLLAWANSNSSTGHHDYAALPLVSMFGENACINRQSSPADQLICNRPVLDVLIFDTSRAVAFPNGRALEDDVVDIVGDPRVLGNDSPFPSTNDRPFLSYLPYLSPPWNAPANGTTLPGKNDDPDDADHASANAAHP